MKISAEAERYADEIFFNSSRVIHEEAKRQLLQHKFVSHGDPEGKNKLLISKALEYRDQLLSDMS